MSKAKVGLLGLYLELYDRHSPRRRPRINRFYEQIAATLRRGGNDVLTAPICRRQSEFNAALRKFEKEQVEALVTLHLAYSPSLESAAALARTSLPIIVLDTTPTFDYGPTQNPDELMFNHGIHGVQDMCNLLVRNAKPFLIEAGHWREASLWRRLAAQLRAARLATAMRRARVGCIGTPFKGMGDFAVPADVLKRTIGITLVPTSAAALGRLAAGLPAAALRTEMAALRQQFNLKGLAEATQRRSLLAGLALRRWIEQQQLSAFTMNFLAITKRSGLPTVPFLEACQAMARGIGYAGEGDSLTAAWVGALATVWPDTTFTEMFCPDWKGNRIFLSHMGEVNPRLLSAKPRLVEHPFPYSGVGAPAHVVGCLRGGPALLVNLAPLPEQRYRLIIAPVNMASIKGINRMANSVHGWLKPAGRVADFLAEYSRWGGTHHAALVYDTPADEIAAAGDLLGWQTILLQ